MLKDSFSNFTLTMNVNTHCLVCTFKEKPIKTEKVNETAQSTIKNHRIFNFFFNHNVLTNYLARQCKKVK